MKEEIVLSQSARNTLPDPAKFNLSRANTYFVVAMEFLLTPNNINAFARRQGNKQPIKQGSNFTFDGDEPIEFEDEHTTLHFFFPKDYAHAAGDSLTGFSNPVSLRRYFYSDRGKDYMLVGVPWNWIDAAPEGDLIIDPTTSVATSEDVWLEDATNKDANSAGLLIGKAADPYPKKRTIIKFNIAGSGIPSSAIVLNAQMKLYYYSASNGGSGSWVDRWVQAHQILVSWNETQATNVNRLSSTPWNVAYVGLNDIDAKSTMESTGLFQSGQTGMWKAWNLTNLTQKWVNGTATNYGAVLWATNEATNGYDLRFYSSEAAPPNDIYKPYLEVVYSTEATTKTVYFLKDHLGSIRATVLDSAGAPVIGYDDYDPWGYPLALRTKPIPNAYLQGASKNKFTGKERDEEYGLNLDYFGARYYDWLTGRWISVDPLWQKHPNISPYAYVLNNPMRLIDPDGKQVDMHIFSELAQRRAGFSEQEVEAANKYRTDERANLLNALVGIGILAAQVSPILITAALSNPVATNEIGIAITEALSPGAENFFNTPSAVGGLTKGELQRLNVAGEVKLGLKSAEEANVPLIKGGAAIEGTPVPGNEKLVKMFDLGKGKFKAVVTELKDGKVASTSVM